MRRLPVILFILLSAGITANAQIVFSFQPEVYGRNVDGLGVFQVQNLTGGTVKGQVMITVAENLSKSAIVTIISPVTTFAPGVSNFSRSAFAGSAFRFQPNTYARLVNQTKNFPPGQYSFCFRFLNSDKTAADDFENCFDADIQPLVPMTLVYPGDGDQICQKRPVLSWQPPIPFHANMRFRLLLTEKKSGESVENLLVNAPLVLLDNITSTTINYPSQYPDLQEGKTYCWQVIAYQEKIIMSRSEIWEFTVQCKENQTPLPNDSYRELKNLQNGNYYIANRVLRFSFTNNYSLKHLNYSILDVSNGSKAMKNVPKVDILPGLNKIDVDLSDLDLEQGKHYILKVYPFNEQAIEVRFIYQDNDVINFPGTP